MKYLLLLFILPLSTYAFSSPHDEYYSSDIFTAIAEARQRTHHYDYSNATRYNRSTSQSIPIPRLLNKEMATTIIEAPQEVDITPRNSNKDNTDLSWENIDSQKRMPAIPLTGSAAVSVKVTVR